MGADDECDLQVGPEHAEKLAELALNDNVPIILDVSGFLMEEESQELIQRTRNKLELQDTNEVMPVRHGTMTFWAIAARVFEWATAEPNRD